MCNDDGREYRELRQSINRACEIIENGAGRFVADDIADDVPPRLTKAEWRELYETLDRARTPLPF